MLIELFNPQILFGDKQLKFTEKEFNIETCKVSATPYVSVSISVSVICISVRVFKLHYSVILYQILCDILIWPDYSLYIIAK